MINHHLSDAMILAYAAGSLSAGQAILVRSHLELCEHCRQRLYEAEAMGGALMESLDEPVDVDLDFDALMSQVESEPSASPETTDTTPQSGSLLTDILGHSLDDVPWKMVGPGIRQFVVPLESSEGEKVRLLKLSPGFVTPEHSHHGSEITLVLKGSFCDETGRYAVGDIQEADDDLDHQPIADTHEDCICLTVTDAPLEFKSVVSRMLQPILGI